MGNNENVKLSESEYRLMEILWENGTIEATALAGICLEKYDWKKPTVYTMLKRLGEKGALSFENRVVTNLVQKGEVDKSESEALVNKAFGGSLPKFMAAFLQNKTLTEEDAERLTRMIEEATKH